MSKIVKSGEADCERVHARLREYNHRHFGVVTDYSYHIEKDGEIAAGIVAASTFDTLEVEFLFVEEKYRKQGLGAELLCHAEALARANGLARVLINTYSFQAPGFYKKLGYTELFKISPCFGEYSQYFFMKQL